MTKHLSPEQFVEAAEGTLAQSVRRHLDACDACRHEVTQLTALMGDVGSAGQMPEPSPLFWEHFSRRVRAATEVEVIRPRVWWQDAWRPLAMAAAVVAVALLAVELRLPRSTAGSEAMRLASLTAVNEADMSASGQPSSTPDEAMDFVTELASDVPWDDLQNVARPSRDVTMAAFGELSAPQRVELARLVKAAMDGAE